MASTDLSTVTAAAMEIPDPGQTSSISRGPSTRQSRSNAPQPNLPKNHLNGNFEHSTGVGARNGLYKSRFAEESRESLVKCGSSVSTIHGNGPSRSRKNTLIDRMARRWRTKDHARSPAEQVVTKTANLPRDVFALPEISAIVGDFTVEANAAKLKTSFIDIGQQEIDKEEDTALLITTPQDSHVIIYNTTGGLVGHRVLNRLGIVTRVAAQLVTKEDEPRSTATPLQLLQKDDDDKAINPYKNDTVVKDVRDAEHQTPLFGHLAVVFGHYPVVLTDDAELVSKSIMDDETCVSEAATQRNDIRELLRRSFESIKVYILADPAERASPDTLKGQDKVQNLLPLQDCDEALSEHSRDLWDEIYDVLAQPNTLLHDHSASNDSITDSSSESILSVETAALNVPTKILSADQAPLIIINDGEDSIDDHKLSITTRLPMFERSRAYYQTEDFTCTRLNMFARQALTIPSRTLLRQH